MYREYWLRSKNHLKKFRNCSIVLFIFFNITSYLNTPSHAASISIDKIKTLEQEHQGDTRKRFHAWRKLIEDNQNKSVTVQLEKVNSFFNQFTYESDTDSKGVEDYWKSPEEFIIDGGGDCEDYAIIKYFSLVALGVPADKLRITYVTSLTLKQAHMVLSYYPSPESEPLILDSLEHKILPASKRSDLKPVYSFNGDGLWLAKQRGQGSSLGQPNSLGKWDDLLKRM